MSNLGTRRIRTAVAFLPEDVGGRRFPDPQPDLEGPLAVARDGLLSLKLQRAHQSGGAGELIEGEEAQCVAHDHAHPGAREPVLARMAQPPQHHRERREAEVRLGLATTRGKEEEVNRVSVGIARVGEARKIEQDEGELERAPARRLAGEPLTERPCDGAVGHAEGLEGVGVLGEQADAALDPVGRETCDTEQLRRRLEACPLQRREARLLCVDPAAILDDERLERCLSHGAIRERPERRHRELDTGHVHGRRLLHLSARDPRRAEYTTGTVHDLPFGRDAMAGCILGGVGVVEISHLLVPFLDPRTAQVRPRHEGTITSHLELGLEHVGEVGLPCVCGTGVRWFTRKTETARVLCGRCPSRSCAATSRAMMWSWRPPDSGTFSTTGSLASVSVAATIASCGCRCQTETGLPSGPSITVCP